MKKKISLLLPMLILFSLQIEAACLIDALDLATRGHSSIPVPSSNTLLAQAIIGLTKTGISIIPPTIASAGILAKVSGWISSAIPLIILNVTLSLLSHSLQPSQEDPSLENQINLKMRALAQLEQYKNSPNPAERELYKKLHATYTEDMLDYVNSEKTPLDLK